MFMVYKLYSLVYTVIVAFFLGVPPIRVFLAFSASKAPVVPSHASDTTGLQADVAPPKFKKYAKLTLIFISIYQGTGASTHSIVSAVGGQ